MGAEQVATELSLPNDPIVSWRQRSAWHVAPQHWPSRRRQVSDGAAFELFLSFRAGLEITAGGGLMIDGLGIGLGFLDLLVFAHALLEGLDALREVAHQLRNLAAPAEQQQADRQHDDPVPNAQ